jgi:hypothetical protein
MIRNKIYLSKADFDQVLDIYTYPFYSEPIHRHFVKNQFRSNYTEVCGSVCLILPASVNHSPSDLQQISLSLIYRYPVYYGREQSNFFNWSKVRDTLGYDNTEVSELSNQGLDHRYAILGKISVMSCESPLTPAILATETGPNIWICHTWGVNLETSETLDYQNLVDHSGQINYNKYLDRHRELFQLIVKSATHARQQDSSQGVDIIIPMIGMGTYLRAMSLKQQKICQHIWLTAFFDMLRNLPHQVHVKLCVYEPTAFTAIISKLRLLRHQYGSKFKLGEGSRSGNLMVDVPNPEQTNRSVCVVNAWDTRSFIGNGGSHDPTLDGMIVSNYGKRNPQFRNTSYLHNSFFCPQLLDTASWV